MDHRINLWNEIKVLGNPNNITYRNSSYKLLKAELKKLRAESSDIVTNFNNSKYNRFTKHDL